MSFFKSLVRRVKRTAKAQITSQVGNFVGRTVSGAVSGATRGITSRIDTSFGNLRNKITAAGVSSRRSGLNPFANIGYNRVAKGAIARAKGEKIVDPFGGG